ncbi:replication protein [Cytobacillus oceanisediminis]|uniref:replication protein n=1 Tax=Cytobacillus oceanisediminis TaxID=665099 RepID=UPI001FB38BAC|nr:replication protein [Cytobacillus oceanisediminis]UOE58041.1 hypothetical protein IRB79_27645 [Cytobacillus oceanisediminis]
MCESRCGKTRSEKERLAIQWLTFYCAKDFTKRQANIMAFLLSFTILTGKIKIHIPRLKDFEQCGVGPTKIKAELQKLEDLGVICWDKENMLFGITLDTSKWKTKNLPHFDEKRFRKLVEINMEEGASEAESTRASVKK